MVGNRLSDGVHPQHAIVKAGSVDLLYGYDAEIARWVANELGVTTFGPSRAIGVGLKGDIIAGVVYFNSRGNNLEMAVASTSPKWASRETLKHFFTYPFITQGCKRVTTLVDTDENELRRFNERLGFKHEGTLREANPNGDAEIYGMLKRECKWVSYGKEKLRQQQPASTA